MLTDEKFNQWFYSFNFSEQSRKVLEEIRSSEPSRRVGGGKKNVSGRYPSCKMGKTIQFESHRNELAHIYKLENDDDVLEYYDQPPPIFLDYLSKSGRRNYHRHTPDFFVIRKNSVGWEECKTEQDLLKLGQDSPNRWYREDNGNWRCPPGEEYASPFNFYYIVRSSSEINSTFLRNFVWLADYFQSKPLKVDELVTSNVQTLVKTQPGIALSEIIHQIEEATIDDLNILIATNQVYVDLNTTFLGKPEQVEVFLNDEEAFIQAQITKVSPLTASNSFCTIKVKVGTSICWDGAIWEFVNTGERAVGLLTSGGKFIDLSNNVFENLFRDGKITGLFATEESNINSEVEALLNEASTEDREEANARYKAIKVFLDGTSSNEPSRTQRRWIASYRKAENLYGRGFVGLFPRHRDKGWRREGIPEEVRLLMEEHIQTCYENNKQPSIRHAYNSFKEL